MSANPRHEAVRTAASRIPRAFDRPTDEKGRVLATEEYYGCNTFSVQQMRRYVSDSVVQKFVKIVEHGEKLTPDVANAIAEGAFKWATERGVTHYCHWFHPMTGATAEKHDAFLSFSGGRPISQFKGGQLVQSEPDASSFPSGGMRATFEARGYTAWDPSSPLFIMERTNGSTLCIPSCFVSYHGAALDKKTPLLRSMDAINKQAVALCNALGDDAVTSVVATAGPEQEYFLIDRAYAALRPDLMVAGRTLIGAPAPRGQSMDDHYFGSVPSRVLAFMQELETELYKVGVPAKTRHNEVAPSQFEIAVVYGEANVAADHNQVLMELVRKVAERHDMKALLHEKPFKGVNGSGKHVNWSMATNTGDNLLEPGATPGDNLRFLAFLGGVLLGVYRHSALLRASIASHGQDFRLGANEAPPAIISVFLGDFLTGICRKIEEGLPAGGDMHATIMELGVSRLPTLMKDNADRNRTSPFAFTGNKFEFRAVGANSSISFPTTAVNTAIADGIQQMTAWVKEQGKNEAGVLTAVRKALTESRAIRFEGDNYTQAWVEQARARGLPNLSNTAEALSVLRHDDVVKVFVDHGVLTPPEVGARYHIMLEQYLTTVGIEVDVLRDLVHHNVLPAALAERTASAQDLQAVLAVGDVAVAADLDRTRSRYQDLCKRINDLYTAMATLDRALDGSNHGKSEHDKSLEYAYKVMPAIECVRSACDALEERVSDERWTLPRYREMLFQN